MIDDETGQRVVDLPQNQDSSGGLTAVRTGTYVTDQQFPDFEGSSEEGSNTDSMVVDTDTSINASVSDHHYNDISEEADDTFEEESEMDVTEDVARTGSVSGSGSTEDEDTTSAANRVLIYGLFLFFTAAFFV
eukprot:TRINITY_DN2569_c2_g1_i2.p1 TRINITY_DN2569_c2_g1~~TRINITY_DN2569_c2_g1_i2.p1  ORF type:complete len:133 (-),score=41.67 TRINITY_DN2569_c2_g1_i2:49-447(-)